MMKSDLSQSDVEKQWEVVGLYCVFIFRKVGSDPSSGNND